MHISTNYIIFVGIIFSCRQKLRRKLIVQLRFSIVLIVDNATYDYVFDNLLRCTSHETVEKSAIALIAAWIDNTLLPARELT